VDTIVDLFPIIPHEAAVGVDCCGCMVPRAKGDKIELVCNECGIAEGSINGAILRAVVTSGIQHSAGGCSGDIVGSPAISVQVWWLEMGSPAISVQVWWLEMTQNMKQKKCFIIESKWLLPRAMSRLSFPTPPVSR
jgi:hypothetical protein